MIYSLNGFFSWSFGEGDWAIGGSGVGLGGDRTPTHTSINPALYHICYQLGDYLFLFLVKDLEIH